MSIKPKHRVALLRASGPRGKGGVFAAGKCKVAANYHVNVKQSLNLHRKLLWVVKWVFRQNLGHVALVAIFQITENWSTPDVEKGL